MKRRMKNIFSSCILAVCIMISLVPMITYADPDTETVVIPEDAIYLSTSDDVLILAENCIDDSWSIGKTVVLENDIDMSDVVFRGIPTFGGTFYGQGYVISGLSAEYEASVVGFFRYTQSGAIVDDLHIEGAIQPSGTSTVVGGIVGVNAGTIQNCSFTGTVSGKEIVGGIAGLNKAVSLIENSTVKGEVFGNHYIGGIAG